MSNVALVTGASKGIGAATALVFGEAGYDVVINYRGGDKQAQEIEKHIKATGQKALLVKADISKPEEVEKMFSEISKEFSKIDVLVNNAGIFDEEDDPDNIKAFERIFQVNLLAQIDVTNHARKLMSKGKIVFISSIHGRLGHGSPNSIAYASQKAALDSYMMNLAKSLAPNILVNSVAPGRTITPMWGDMSEDYKKEMAEGQLINRWIKPEEIADAVLFLVNNDAICGEVLTVDGGMGLKTLD